jgi:hypothetical protein
MKKYTQEEALQQIFGNNKKPLTAKLLVYKFRYKNKTLSQKSIDNILKSHNFIVVKPILYGKIKKPKKRYAVGIQKVRYVSIQIDVKTYNRIVRVEKVKDGGTSDIQVSKWFLKRLNQDNDFVRLKCDKYYIDIKLKKFILIENLITISFGDIIDSNNTSRIIEKKHDNKN